MIKLINESLEREYTPCYAVIDLQSDEIYCDSDELADLFFTFQELVYKAAVQNDHIITERIINELNQIKNN